MSGVMVRLNRIKRWNHKIQVLEEVAAAARGSPLQRVVLSGTA
jgi:hypothetical protein